MKKFLSAAVILFIALLIGSPLYAAPDPGSLHKLKSDAKIHLKASVIKDDLISEQKNPPAQQRVMTVRIDRLMRVDPALDWQVKKEVNISYSYIPGWGDYVGGKSIQIRSGDEIELWADIEEGLPSLVLGGYGIEVLKSNGARIEHMSEPLASRWRHWQSSDASLTIIILIGLGTAVLLVYILTCRFGNAKKA